MQKIGLVLLSFGVGFALLLTGQATAANTMPIDVKVFNNNTSELESSFYAFPAANHNGGDVAVADFDGDGYGEIIVAPGKGSGPHVKMFSKAGAAEKIDFFPFKQEFRGGLTVGSGKFLEGRSEQLIVAPKSGGQARIRVYKVNEEREIISEFLAYPESFNGGANVTAGDFDGDGVDEIATAPGISGSPLIRIFEYDGTFTGKEFYAFNKDEKGGAYLDAGDIDGDGIDELVVGHGPYGESYVKVFDVHGERESLIGNWKALGDDFFGGVKVNMADLDQDGEDEILTGAGFGGGPHMQGWTSEGKLYKVNNMVYAADFRGSFNIDSGDIDRDGKTEIITVSDRAPAGNLQHFRYIDVSLGEQHLWAYEGGQVAMDFPISSGTSKYPTPKGEFSILNHIPKTRMAWEYGPDHPDNYDLPDVPYVMAFDPPYNFHGAYWHNNFGVQMSHGCVNISVPNSARLYNWARNGDAVIVR